MSEITKRCPLVYSNTNDRPVDAKVVYLVLGYIQFEDEDDDAEPEKVWEIVESRSDLFEFFKVNYDCLDLYETRVYTSSNKINEEYNINMASYTSAIDMIRSLQRIFNSDFNIDELI